MQLIVNTEDYYYRGEMQGPDFQLIVIVSPIYTAGF